MFRFFQWLRSFWRRGSSWGGFDAVDDIKVDSPEEWRDRNYP